MALDALPEDFRDFLVALADARAEFVLLVSVTVDGRAIRVIGREVLLINRKAAGRLKDLDDVAWLEAHPPKHR